MLFSKVRQFPRSIGFDLTIIFAMGLVAVLVVGFISLRAAQTIFNHNKIIEKEAIHLGHLTDIQTSLQVVGISVHHEALVGEGKDLGTLFLPFDDINRAIGIYLEMERREGLHRQMAQLSNYSLAVSEAISRVRSTSEKLVGGKLRTGRVDNRLHLEFMQQLKESRDAVAKAEALIQRDIGLLVKDSSGLMRRIMMFYFLFLGVGSAFILAVRLGAYHFVVRPLRRLAAATSDIAAGNFGRRLTRSGRSEIGQLVDSFNAMSEKLQQHQRELRDFNLRLQRKAEEAGALYEVGMEISSFLELDKILNSVASKLKEVLRADAVVLCLVDEEGDRLVPKATCGPRAAFNLTQESAKAAVCSEASECPFIRPDYCLGRLVVPIKKGENTLGSICVASRQLREFTAEETNLASGLATQAGIAIENAQLYRQAQQVAILTERDRIAREMHDTWAQTLAYIQLENRLIIQMLESGEEEKAQTHLRTMSKKLTDTYEEVRQAILSLQTKVYKGAEFVPVLTEYLHEFGQQTGLVVQLQVKDRRASRLPAGADIQLIRIVQEALANIWKHARARRAWVRLESELEGIKVTIEDDGQGFDPRQLSADDRGRFGLRSMRERAESLGGSLEVDSAPGKGCRVLVWLPKEG